MRSTRSILIVFLLFFGISARAQQMQPSGTAIAGDQQATSLLKTSLAALMGSAPALPNTLVASGTFAPSFNKTAPSYSVLVHMQGADKFRWEASLPQGTTATVINGQNAQLQSSSDTKPLAAWQYAGKKAENFPIFLLARWLSSNGIEVHLIGQENIAGQALYHISIVDHTQRMQPLNPWHRDQHRGEYELYLDPVTSLPVRLHYYQETSDTYFHSLVPVDIVYSNFQPISGTIFPLTLTKYFGQTKVSVLQLQSIQPNGAVSAQDFQLR